jgi:hypothetical protein
MKNSVLDFNRNKKRKLQHGEKFVDKYFTFPQAGFHSNIFFSDYGVACEESASSLNLRNTHVFLAYRPVSFCVLTLNQLWITAVGPLGRTIQN